MLQIRPVGWYATVYDSVTHGRHDDRPTVTLPVEDYCHCLLADAYFA